MTKDKKPLSNADWDRLLDRTHTRSMRFVQKSGQISDAGAQLWFDFCTTARNAKKRAMFDHGVGALAIYYELTGQLRNAEQAHDDRERFSPKAIEPKLARARFYGTTLNNPERALSKLAEIKLPQKPRGGQVDTCFNVLACRGLMLLRAGNRKAALKAMNDLASFAERYVGKTIFFFDMYFVREMISKRLALSGCKRYLQATLKQQQVAHDAAEAKRLLTLLTNRKQPRAVGGLPSRT